MNRKQGSTLVLILSVIFVLFSGILKCWRISSFRIDVQMQREIYYKRFCLTDGILRATIAQLVNKFDQVVKMKEPVRISFVDEMKNTGYSAYSKVSVVRVKNKVRLDELLITAFLIKGQDIVFSIRCLLNKKRIVGQSKLLFFTSGYTIT